MYRLPLPHSSSATQIACVALQERRVEDCVPIIASLCNTVGGLRGGTNKKRVELESWVLGSAVLRYRGSMSVLIIHKTMRCCHASCCCQACLLVALHKVLSCARGGCRAGLRLQPWWQVVLFDVCVVSSLAACIEPRLGGCFLAPRAV